MAKYDKDNAAPAPAAALPSGASTTAGGTTLAAAHVTTSTGAATLVAARTGRRSVVIQNIDATDTVWIGPATVSASNGLRLKPGESVTLDTAALLQAIAGANTPAVAYVEIY